MVLTLEMDISKKGEKDKLNATIQNTGSTGSTYNEEMESDQRANQTKTEKSNRCWNRLKTLPSSRNNKHKQQ